MCDFFPSIGMLIGLTCKKVQLLFLVRQFSNSKFSKAVGLNSFLEMLFVGIGLFVIVVGCMFDRFFMCHIDRKYRSATGLLLNKSIQNSGSFVL